jgi:hypothetical protein
MFNWVKNMAERQLGMLTGRKTWPNAIWYGNLAKSGNANKRPQQLDSGSK